MPRRPALFPDLILLGWRLGEDRSGVAALEFAFIAPVLALLLAGLVDGSRMFSQSMQVRAAAQAGADYARAHPGPSNPIALAAKASTPLAVTAVVDQFSACLSGQTMTVVQTASCPSGGAAGRYVSVLTEATFTPLLKWPGVAPAKVQGEAFVRVQ